VRSPRRIRGRKFFNRNGGRKRKEEGRGRGERSKKKKEIFSPRLT